MFYEIMSSISLQPQLNTTVFLFALVGYVQYFGVQMQKYSEKGSKLPKIYTVAVCRGQGGARGNVL